MNGNVPDRTSNPLNGLQSISIEPRGVGYAVISCFRGFGEAQAARDGIASLATELKRPEDEVARLRTSLERLNRMCAAHVDHTDAALLSHINQIWREIRGTLNGERPLPDETTDCPGHLWTDRPVCIHCGEQMPEDDKYCPDGEPHRFINGQCDRCSAYAPQNGKRESSEKASGDPEQVVPTRCSCGGFPRPTLMGRTVCSVCGKDVPQPAPL